LDIDFEGCFPFSPFFASPFFFSSRLQSSLTEADYWVAIQDGVSFRFHFFFWQSLLWFFSFPNGATLFLSLLIVPSPTTMKL